MTGGGAAALGSAWPELGKESRPGPDGGGWRQQEPDGGFPSARRHTDPVLGKDAPGKTTLPGQGCQRGWRGTPVLPLYQPQQPDFSKALGYRCGVPV